VFSDLIEDIKIQIGEHVDMSHVKIVTDFNALGEMVAIKSYMYSIFYNLISNAIKFNKPGENPVIEIKSGRTPDKIILTFKDNGMGINVEENKNKVFELYRRFHTHIEGKGVGLFMSKVQVEALGGTINIKSKVNEGAIFTIELPV
jgi:signal transduction histidine kinase